MQLLSVEFVNVYYTPSLTNTACLSILFMSMQIHNMVVYFSHPKRATFIIHCQFPRESFTVRFETRDSLF